MFNFPAFSNQSLLMNLLLLTLGLAICWVIYQQIYELRRHVRMQKLQIRRLKNQILHGVISGDLTPVGFRLEHEENQETAELPELDPLTTLDMPQDQPEPMAQESTSPELVSQEPASQGSIPLVHPNHIHSTPLEPDTPPADLLPLSTLKPELELEPTDMSESEISSDNVFQTSKPTTQGSPSASVEEPTELPVTKEEEGDVPEEDTVAPVIPEEDTAVAPVIPEEDIALEEPVVPEKEDVAPMEPKKRKPSRRTKKKVPQSEEESRPILRIQIKSNDEN